MPNFLPFARFAALLASTAISCVLLGGVASAAQDSPATRDFSIVGPTSECPDGLFWPNGCPKP